MTENINVQDKGQSCCCEHNVAKPVAGTGDQRIHDPVCGMLVNPDETHHYYDHGDNRFYFCSEGCRKAFSRKANKMFKTKGPIGRWLDRLGKSAEEEYGASGPKCC